MTNVNPSHLETSQEPPSRDEKKRSLWQKFFLIAIACVGLFFAITGLILPLRPVRSEVEKRELAKAPAFSPEALWDGSFLTALSDWYADTYPARDSLLTAKSRLEAIYGVRTTAVYNQSAKTADEIPEADKVTSPAALMKDEENTGENDAGESEAAGGKTILEEGDETNQNDDDENHLDDSDAASAGEKASNDPAAITAAPEASGSIYVADGRGFDLYYFSRENADAYASMVNTVRSKLPDNVALYDIVVPNASGVLLAEDVQKSLGASDQEDAIDYIYSLLDPAVKTVPVFNSLTAHRDEYIYFRTDHHWTQLGAYYAYETFCRAKGITANPLDEYETRTYDGFLGTFYAASGQAPPLLASVDTITAYVPLSTNDMTFEAKDGTTVNWHIISDVTNYDAAQKYSCFAAGDQALATIDNPSLSDGSSALVVKESYGNAFVPFLTDHYDKVYIVDYRHTDRNLLQFVKENGIDDVIFLNNDEFVTKERAKTINGLFR